MDSQPTRRHFAKAAAAAIATSQFPILGANAVLGAVYPGIIAVRQDPIEALAYE